MAAVAVARRKRSEISEAGNALECASADNSVYMIQRGRSYTVVLCIVIVVVVVILVVAVVVSIWS